MLVIGFDGVGWTDQIRKYAHVEMMKLLIPLEFGNGWIISSHNFVPLDMWLLFYAAGI